MNTKLISRMGFIVAFLMYMEASAMSVDEIHVLKISGKDQRAVIREAEGKKRVVKPGDVLRSEDTKDQVAGSGLRDKTGDNNEQVNQFELRVVEIAEGRVVLEEKKGNDKVKIIIRMVEGQQTVERIRKTGEKRPVTLKLR